MPTVEVWRHWSMTLLIAIHPLEVWASEISGRARGTCTKCMFAVHRPCGRARGFLCVRACVHARVRACVYVQVCVCVNMRFLYYTHNIIRTCVYVFNMQMCVLTCHVYGAPPSRPSLGVSSPRPPWRSPAYPQHRNPLFSSRPTRHAGLPGANVYLRCHSAPDPALRPPARPPDPPTLTTARE